MVKWVSLVVMLIAGDACAGEPPHALPPAAVGPGEIPAIDVEANVRKMLEESGSRQPAPAGAAAAPPPAAPTAGPTIAPRRTPAPAPVELEPEDYVPLPEETITVRSVGDVEDVDRQLKDAQRRKAPVPAANGSPAR